MCEMKFRAVYNNYMYSIVGITPVYVILYKNMDRKLCPPIELVRIGLECDDLVIEQFTGIYDSKGTEIYEGDIVESRHLKHPTMERDGYEYMNWPIEQRAPIIRQSPTEWSWGIYGHIEEALTYPDREFIVVGNIHEIDNFDIVIKEEL